MRVDVCKMPPRLIPSAHKVLARDAVKSTVNQADVSDADETGPDFTLPLTSPYEKGSLLRLVRRRDEALGQTSTLVGIDPQPSAAFRIRELCRVIHRDCGRHADEAAASSVKAGRQQWDGGHKLSFPKHFNGMHRARGLVAESFSLRKIAILGSRSRLKGTDLASHGRPSTRFPPKSPPSTPAGPQMNAHRDLL